MCVYLIFDHFSLLQLYDWVLTLHLEIKLIWFSRWSYTKVLFLLLRYMTFVSVWISIISEFRLSAFAIALAQSVWQTCRSLVVHKKSVGGPRRSKHVRLGLSVPCFLVDVNFRKFRVSVNGDFRVGRLVFLR